MKARSSLIAAVAALSVGAAFADSYTDKLKIQNPAIFGTKPTAVDNEGISTKVEAVGWIKIRNPKTFATRNTAVDDNGVSNALPKPVGKAGIKLNHPGQFGSRPPEFDDEGNRMVRIAG